MIFFSENSNTRAERTKIKDNIVNKSYKSLHFQTAAHENIASVFCTFSNIIAHENLAFFPAKNISTFGFMASKRLNPYGTSHSWSSKQS